MAQARKTNIKPGSNAAATGLAPKPLALQWLAMWQFKSYGQARIHFHPEMNCISGLNGAGKTNLLDAIHLICLTKSRFQRQDQDLVQHGQDFYRLEAQFLLEEKTENFALTYRLGEKKILKHNHVPEERMADHVGRLPLALLAPDDNVLIRGASDERRKFFDNLLSQAFPAYLQQLQAYNRLLLQRNNLLATALRQGHRPDPVLLDAYDEPFLLLNQQIAQQRRQGMQALEPLVKDFYARLSNQREEPRIDYLCQVEEPDFAQVFSANRRLDVDAGRTLRGCHRDDFDFLLDGHPVKRFGSQGQQKTFLLSLHLAKAQFLAQHCQTLPLLLLDDILEKLDPERIAALLTLIGGGRMGQVFITDAGQQRLREVTANYAASHFIIEAENYRSQEI